MSLTPIKIFVSSPGDVAQERFLTEKVIVRLQNVYQHVCKLEPIFWEHEPLTATQSFQEGLISPRETDIVICILWSRLGTRLPRTVTAGKNLTGTEFEFLEAVEGKKQKGVPDLLVYRKMARPVADLSDRHRRTETLRQIEALEAFIERWFHDEEQALIAAFHPFERADEFEEHLEHHLRKLIEARLHSAGISLEDGVQLLPTWPHGSPFRGLNHFDFEHEPIFFGRTKAIGDVVDRLKRQAEAGRAFLLVSGMSGCGKSSLVRAGVLPALSRPGVIEGVGLCRRVVLRPGDGPGGLFDTVAAALLRKDALPELANDGTTAAQLAQALRANPGGVALLVKGALSQAAARLQPAEEGAVQPGARLLFIVDQLEELFTLDTIPVADRKKFAELLKALACDPLSRTWVMATLRSDFYAPFAAMPEFAELKEGLGHYDLPPPTPAEIGQLIRQPALAGGARFEETKDGARLDDLLRDEALQDSAVLPLLEFLLHELYERRTERGQLTFEAYHTLGGVTGALARRAEATFNELPAEVQRELPAVFRQLVTLGTLSEDTPTRKTVPLRQFEAVPTRLGFVRAFIEARLFVSDHDDRTAVVRITHEALLLRWQRLQTWLAADKELLLVRARVEASTSRWVHEGRRADLLLPAGKSLQEAEQLEAAGFELEPATQELIAASRKRARRNRLLRETAIVALVCLTLGIAAFAGFALVQYFKAAQLAREKGELADVNGKLAADNGRLATQEAAKAEQARRAGELAKKKTLEAEKQRDQAEMLAYVGQITLAQREWEYGDPKLAWYHLQSCQGSLRGWEHRYLYTLFTRNHITLEGHTSSVSSVAFSPDGKRLVSASHYEPLKVWDADKGSETLTLQGHTSWINAVAFSPDGKRIVSGSGGYEWRKDAQLRLLPGEVKVWDAEKGNEILSLKGHTNSVNAVAFSPDGKRLVSGSADDTLKVWDADKGNEISTLKGHTNSVNAVAFSPDGKRLVSGSDDGTLKVWDADKGSESSTLKGHTGSVKSVAFSPDGKRLVSASSDKTLKVWDADKGTETLTLKGHTAGVTSVAISPDGKRLVSGSADKTLKVWDADKGSEISTLKGHTGGVSAVAFSPDGKRFVSASDDKTLKMWPANKGSESMTLKGHTSYVSSVAFSPDGKRIASASKDKTLKVWDADKGSEMLTLKGHTDGVNAEAFSPDGKYIVSGSDDKTLKVWDADKGTESLTLKGHTGSVSSVAFSPDGKRLVSGSCDLYGRTGEVKVWDAATGSELLTLKGHTREVTSVAISFDGKRLVSGSWDDTLKVWDADKGSVTFTLRGHSEIVQCVAFSLNGKRIVSASHDKTLKVWDADKGSEMLTLKGHTDQVLSVAFSPDGKRIVSGSLDNTLKIWDADKGTETLTLKGHTGGVNTVAFSPDGKHIVSGSWDNTVKVWDADKGSEP